MSPASQNRSAKGITLLCVCPVFPYEMSVYDAEKGYWKFSFPRPLLPTSPLQILSGPSEKPARGKKYAQRLWAGRKKKTSCFFYGLQSCERKHFTGNLLQLISIAPSPPSRRGGIWAVGRKPFCGMVDDIFGTRFLLETDFINLIESLRVELSKSK